MAEKRLQLADAALLDMLMKMKSRGPERFEPTGRATQRSPALSPQQKAALSEEIRLAAAPLRPVVGRPPASVASRSNRAMADAAQFVFGKQLDRGRTEMRNALNERGGMQFPVMGRTSVGVEPTGHPSAINPASPQGQAAAAVPQVATIMAQAQAQPQPAGVTPRTSQTIPGSGGEMGRGPRPSAAAQQQIAALDAQRRRSQSLSMQELEAKLGIENKQKEISSAWMDHETQTSREDEDAAFFQQREQLLKKDAQQQEKDRLQGEKMAAARKDFTAQRGEVEAERQAAPTQAVAQTVAGVENTGNLASPGATSRGTYDTDGAGAGSAIMAAAGATGDPTLAAQARPQAPQAPQGFQQGPQGAQGANSVNIGGQAFTAPARINSSEFSYAPHFTTDRFGVTSGSMAPSFASRSTDNVLSAGDVATLRMRQQERAGETFQGLMQEYGGTVDAGRLSRLSNAIATGDMASAAVESHGLPFSLTQQVKREAIAADSMRRQVSFVQLQTALLEFDQLSTLTPLDLMGRGMRVNGGSNGSAGSKGVDIGELTNLLTSTQGKGTNDKPNELGYYAIQDQFLRMSGGRFIPWLKQTPESWYGDGETTIETTRSVGYMARLVQQANNQQDTEAMKKLEAIGGFRTVLKGNGELQIIADASNVNGMVGAQAVLDYVNGSALAAARAVQSGQDYIDPLLAENPQELVEPAPEVVVGPQQQLARDQKVTFEERSVEKRDLERILLDRTLSPAKRAKAQARVVELNRELSKSSIFGIQNPFNEAFPRRRDRMKEALEAAKAARGY